VKDIIKCLNFKIHPIYMIVLKVTVILLTTSGFVHTSFFENSNSPIKKKVLLLLSTYSKRLKNSLMLDICQILTMDLRS
jgi:hypothetical protein